jgi:copper chaperone CopZ
MEGVDEVNVDLPTGQVKIKGSGINLDKIAVKVNEIGYLYKGTV